MNLQQLEGFVKIAETEKVSRAAELLHVTQPALSHRIYLLEKEWGIALFERNGKNVALNENGYKLLPMAQQVLKDMKQLQEMAENQKRDSHEDVILNICSASSWVMRSVLQFQQKYPYISVVPYYHSNSREVAADLVIESGHDPVDSPYGTTLVEEELLIGFPEGHPLYRKEGVELKTLADVPFLCGNKEFALTRDTLYFCKQAGFSPKVVYGLSNEEHRQNMVKIGRGVAFFTTATRLNAVLDKIVLAKVLDVKCYRYINMVCCKKDHTLPRVMKLYYFLERSIGMNK